MVVMTMSDVLTLNFFWMVRDEGSWLDIGTTISHFVIASLLCVFVAVLEFLSEVFVSGVNVEDRRRPVRDLNGTAAAAGGRLDKPGAEGNGKLFTKPAV